VSSEDRFVEAVRALLPAGGPVVLGPGDDAAILEREGGLLAVTTDMLVEGVDFLAEETPETIGRRAVSVNLSDLAAVGAEPEALVLAIGFRGRRGPDYPLAITRAAAERAAEFGARVVGGDLSEAPVTVVSVALWGRPAGRLLTRSGARPGEDLWISGYPGRAAAGLRLARRGSPPSPAEQELVAAYRDPEPRVALGAALAREGVATAAIDVSDGVGVDAFRLARASEARIVLERVRLPVSATLGDYAAREGADPIDWLLCGGDDYELLFTAGSSDRVRVEGCAGASRVPVTRVGRVEAGHGAVLQEPGGERSVEDLGFDHLRSVS
jgi:thiamine-monophosphate kinase